MTKLSNSFSSFFFAKGDLYKRLNATRDWFNANVPGFDLYLEDAWNDYEEGETWFEYNLRSLDTYNETAPIAFDVYKNHQDSGGVWHLDDYQYSRLEIASPEAILDFPENKLAISPIS